MRRPYKDGNTVSTFSTAGYYAHPGGESRSVRRNYVAGKNESPAQKKFQPWQLIAASSFLM
jgi:hypothetical protein